MGESAGDDACDATFICEDVDNQSIWFEAKGLDGPGFLALGVLLVLKLKKVCNRGEYPQIARHTLCAPAGF